MFTFNPAMAVDSDQMEDGDETFDTRNLSGDEEEDNIDVCSFNMQCLNVKHFLAVANLLCVFCSIRKFLSNSLMLKKLIAVEHRQLKTDSDRLNWTRLREVGQEMERLVWTFLSMRICLKTQIYLIPMMNATTILNSFYMLCIVDSKTLLGSDEWTYWSVDFCILM